MSRLRDALDRIALARSYTLGLLDTIDPADWFRMPTEGVTHVAWQVGHLAMADYLLCLKRVRGVRPDDEQVIPAAFIKSFARESVPDRDPARYPPPAEIRATLDRVRRKVLADLADFPDADLDSSIDPPHRIAKTKIATLQWCADHEYLHAGQIALLRRLLGHRPVW